LLATGSTVTGAAAASGYTNTSAFIAAFRDAFGVTPAAYRNSSGFLPGEVVPRPAS
jgi:AraC-like DNA-binding protein